MTSAPFQSSTVSRKIIHCDADCFFAAIEMRDDPSLRGRPVAVGGASDRRGVIATCNYEARLFGVRSAMPTATAMRLCPDLILIPGNMTKYRQAAMQIREIFYDYSDLVEPLSLDEAYIDVTDSELCLGSATLMAEDIRQRVRDEVGITVSAGVAPNKFLAKIASDWNKPDGLFVVTPAQVEAFTRQLPVNRLFGVGAVTAHKLQNMGVTTCDDLRDIGLLELSRHFGRFGARLHQLSYGVDHREVKVSRQRKSLSVEHTYAEDLANIERCLGQLPELYGKLSQRLGALEPAYQVAKQFVKVKFNNFQSTTMECMHSGTPRMTVYKDLCRQACERGDGLPVRLLGLGVRFQTGALEHVQLPLFPDSVP